MNSMSADGRSRRNDDKHGATRHSSPSRPPTRCRAADHRASTARCPPPVDPSQTAAAARHTLITPKHDGTQPQDCVQHRPQHNPNIRSPFLSKDYLVLFDLPHCTPSAAISVQLGRLRLEGADIHLQLGPNLHERPLFWHLLHSTWRSGQGPWYQMPSFFSPAISRNLSVKRPLLCFGRCVPRLQPSWGPKMLPNCLVWSPPSVIDSTPWSVAFTA